MVLGICERLFLLKVTVSVVSYKWAWVSVNVFF